MSFYSSQFVTFASLLNLIIQIPEATSVLVKADAKEKLVKPLLNILFRNDNYSKFQVHVHVLCMYIHVYMYVNVLYMYSVHVYMHMYYTVFMLIKRKTYM